MKPNLTLDKEGTMHPCNGYVLVQEVEQRTDLIVIRSGDDYRPAVVLETSDDETEPVDITALMHPWSSGDLIYFKDSIEVDGHTFVHWTDVVAYKRLT